MSDDKIELEDFTVSRPLAVHGYDDAVAGRTRLLNATARWSTTTEQDLRLAGQHRDLGHVVRSCAMRGIELTSGDTWNVSALSRRIHAEDRRVAREAPLVYVSHGVTDKLEEFSATVPDVHVLPFAEPMILWFATPLEGDDFEPFAHTDLQLPVPIRCAIVRPSVTASGNPVIYYHAIMFVDDVTSMQVSYTDPETGVRHSTLASEGLLAGTRETLVPRLGEYHGESLGQVTCGVSAEPVGRAATVVARALNAMSAREVRMVEDETDVKRTRKEAKRAGVREPGAINVIYLPREKKPGSRYVPPETDSHGQPRRRHGVRAHWRRQPYGPKGAGQWRWTRIEAHERGKGAKLTGETVYAARPPKEQKQ